MIEGRRQINHKTTNAQHEKLVRIIAKASLLPKLYYCHIRLLASSASDFRIIPGKRLELGQEILKNNQLATIYIRYGLEWQIWYRASKGRFSHCLYDLAAVRVTALFRAMLTTEEQHTVAMALPENFEHVLRKFTDAGSSIPQLTDDEVAYLALLREKEPEGAETLSPAKAWDELLATLANPTEALFIAGGDVRLQIEPQNLLNVYGCRPFPRPEAYTFSSSTATSVSNYGYKRVEFLRQKMIERCLTAGMSAALNNLAKETANSIRNILSLAADCNVILSPSGTDSTLHTAGLATLLYDKPIVSIVVGSDQTGSGVHLAAAGKHFATCTARGAQVVKGARIEGFPKNMEVIPVPMRDEHGRLLDNSCLDRTVQLEVNKAISRGYSVILHVMDQSKLGYRIPSPKVVDQLAQRHGNKLLIVLDACQLRLETKDLKKCLGKGYLVTITGSKFFTGPPFSGAVIVPPSLSKRLCVLRRLLPTGLADYSNIAEWPAGWRCIKTLDQGYNLGVYMRWQAALCEMQRYRNVPKVLRLLALDLFCAKVLDLFNDTPYIELLSESNQPYYSSSANGTELTARRTIFPFFISSCQDGAKILSAEQVDKLYVLLNKDITALILESSSYVKNLASQCCHIGQPVKLTHPSGEETAVLRISVGARLVSECWQSRNISLFLGKVKEEVAQVKVIIQKIGLILKYQDLLQ